MSKAKLALAAIFAGSLMMASARAQESINLTAASSHPETLHYVELLSKFYIPEVNRRLAEQGKYKINWTEAYGGKLYQYAAALSSVSEGVTDIGIVFPSAEYAKLPLNNVGLVTPFTTPNLGAILDTVNVMNAEIPALKEEWAHNNAVFLAAAGVETYHLFTSFPINKLDDLKGRKISGPGLLLAWLKGTSAVPLNGAVSTYYTDIQTGVTEGALSNATTILPARIYEVAPYVTKVDAGALYAGVMAINKDSYEALPAEVQTVLLEVGKEYSRKLSETVDERYKTALTKMVEAGAAQKTPVTVTDLPQADREAWINNLPNLAGDWAAEAEAKGLPAREVLTRYFSGLREHGVEPSRDWDKMVK